MCYELLKIDNFCPQNELLPEKQKIRYNPDHTLFVFFPDFFFLFKNVRNLLCLSVLVLGAQPGVRYWMFGWCPKYSGVARLNVRKTWTWKQAKARLLPEPHQ